MFCRFSVFRSTAFHHFITLSNYNSLKNFYFRFRCFFFSLMLLRAINYSGNTEIKTDTKSLSTESAQRRPLRQPADKSETTPFLQTRARAPMAHLDFPRITYALNLLLLQRRCLLRLTCDGDGVLRPRRRHQSKKAAIGTESDAGEETLRSLAVDRVFKVFLRPNSVRKHTNRQTDTPW